MYCRAWHVPVRPQSCMRCTPWHYQKRYMRVYCFPTTWHVMPTQEAGSSPLQLWGSQGKQGLGWPCACAVLDLLSSEGSSYLSLLCRLLLLCSAPGLPLGGMPLSSQPLMVSPTGPTLSPTGKTPLATYFEETTNTTMVSPSGAAAAGAPGLMSGLTTGATPESLLADNLAGFSLNGQTGAAADDAAGGLAHLQLGVSPGLAPGAGGAGTAGRSYSPLGGGLPLFGDASLLVPSSAAGGTGGASGAGSAGAGVAAGIVGV